jgi:predicted nuclease with TOPRIM domain
LADDRNRWLIEKAELQEQPFRSDAPLVGPLIARVREAWNSVATRWYVRALVQQQNQFNRLVAQRLAEQDERLIEQDREQTQLIHDLAELTAQLAQANRLLSSIDQRLGRLEAQADKRDES